MVQILAALGPRQALIANRVGPSPSPRSPSPRAGRSPRQAKMPAALVHGIDADVRPSAIEEPLQRSPIDACIHGDAVKGLVGLPNRLPQCFVDRFQNARRFDWARTKVPSQRDSRRCVGPKSPIETNLDPLFPLAHLLWNG
jgi:hypothetical protein